MPSTEEEIFCELIMLPVMDRAAFLARRCSGNKHLQHRIQQLLAAHESESGILNSSPKISHQTKPPLSKENCFVGPYRLIKKVGDGGFGVVYLAEDTSIDLKVAVKIIKPWMDSDSVVARFESERQVLAIMNHPNIARIFGGGAIDNGQSPYIVMEFVDGIPITDFCDKHMLNVEERLKLFVSVCDAVQHAHQKGIIHRDIKPSNVMVTQIDGEPVVKVIDFGVARAINGHIKANSRSHGGAERPTRVGTMLGTPQYMSPEQADLSELDIDTRSDVYSLTALLYKLLTGHTYLDSEVLLEAGLIEMLRQIQETLPLKPSQRIQQYNATETAKSCGVSQERLRKLLARDLDWIIIKGLEKERDRRYQSVKELAADINRSLSNLPVLAGPPSYRYRLSKFTRRHRAKLAFAALLMVALIVIATGLSVQYQQQVAIERQDEIRLSSAIDSAESALITASRFVHSNEKWTAATLMFERVNELLESSAATELTRDRAARRLNQFELASSDRDFTLAIEELLIRQSTISSTDRLTKQEVGFRNILKARGYDLSLASPSEVESRLARDHAPIKLTDALELWLFTRQRLSEAGLRELSPEKLAAWATAMENADPNPLRTAIRNVLFRREACDLSQLNRAVADGDLSTMCARKLAWLSLAYEQLGDSRQAKAIFDFAIARYPNDVMLNFEHANRLQAEQRDQEAIRYFMRCTSIRPENAGLWKALAISHGRNDEIEEAIDTILTSIKYAPEDGSAYVQLAIWYLHSDHPTEAFLAAQKAISAKRSVAVGANIIQKAKLTPMQYRQTLDALRKIRSKSPPVDNTLLNRWIQKCKQELLAP